MNNYKKVNITSNKGLALSFLNINTSSVNNIDAPLSAICTALQMDCTVEEITPNGLVELNMDNFSMDLSIDDTVIEDNTPMLLNVVHDTSIQPFNRTVFINKLAHEQNQIKNKKY